MTRPLFRVPLVAAIATGAALLVSQVGANAASSSSSIPVVDDSALQASTTVVGGGANPQPSANTIPHWWGSTTDPHNGVTYGYNMVGADPNNCSGSACDVTVEVDLTPVIVNVQGMTFDGSSVLAPTLASPQFANNDYGSTNWSTGGPGTLSQGDAGNLLQLEDATMRAQFNKTGASPYHVRLHVNVKPAETVNVPSNLGVLRQSGRGVVFADVDIKFWSTRIEQMMQASEPTHLPLFLTDSVMNYTGGNPANCCVIGFHGAGEVVGHGLGSTHGNGNQQIQTFSWASYIHPGIFRGKAVQDIHAVSHEIAEWGDDPFTNNLVEPWLTPTAPQYGCTNILETGDPVVGIGFAKGTNTFEQGPNPNRSQSADGYYHPEDEVFLPWFMRSAPNTVSEPTQSPSANGGRYTLMGNLNPFAGFRAPATGC